MTTHNVSSVKQPTAREIRAALIAWYKAEQKSGVSLMKTRSVTLERMYREQRRLWRLACRLARHLEKRNARGK